MDDPSLCRSFPRSKRCVAPDLCDSKWGHLSSSTDGCAGHAGEVLVCLRILGCECGSRVGADYGRPDPRSPPTRAPPCCYCTTAQERWNRPLQHCNKRGRVYGTDATGEPRQRRGQAGRGGPVVMQRRGLASYRCCWWGVPKEVGVEANGAPHVHEGAAPGIIQLALFRSAGKLPITRGGGIQHRQRR